MTCYRITVFVIGLSLAGCLSSEEQENELATESDVLYFETINFGQSGSLADTTEAVYRSADEWEPVRDSLRSTEPFRSVDFSQTMLLIAALPQLSGGYRVQFESVETVEDKILASYVVYVPGPDCLTFMALTLPYQVVAVRRAAGHVEFQRRIELESCATD